MSTIPNQIDRRVPAETMRSVAFMPWFGEFGVMVGYWIRFVHHYAAENKIVCCRPGDEALYPSATHFINDFIDPVPDHKKSNSAHRHNNNPSSAALKIRLVRLFGEDLQFEYPRSVRFSRRYRGAPFPIHPLHQRGLAVDITLGCRCRDYKPERNWGHWTWLTEQLVQRGYRVGVVGRRETSFDPPAASIRAWEYGDDTDANLELLKSSKLYIGSDTGSSHLAAFCSIPSLLFRYPDPWSGVERMQQTTSARSCLLASGWDEPREVLSAALQQLDTLS